MDKTQILKIVSFVLSIVMLVVALTAIICLFAMPNPLAMPNPFNTGGSGNGSNNDNDADDDGKTAGEQFGYAFALILIIPLVIGAMSVHAAYSVATLVLNIRQLFAGKNRKTALLVMNLISVVWLTLLTLACLTSNQPLLHVVFHVFVVVSLAFAVASSVIDLLLIKSKDENVQSNFSQV